jgi:hypothetical protein
MRWATDGRPGGPRPALPRPGERGIVPRRAGYRGPLRPPERNLRRRRSSLGRRLRATVHKRPRQLADGKLEYGLLDHPLITPTLFPSTPSRRPWCRLGKEAVIDIGHLDAAGRGRRSRDSG